MTGIERAVEDHYAAYNVLERIRAGLVAGGHDPDRIAPDVLKPVDEFHIGGAEATATLLDGLDIAPDMDVLDIGSGIGGTARLVALRTGARVCGVDLTADFVRTARALSAMCGMDDRVRFEQGSATALPFPDDAFDLALLLHVGMNIPDKALMFREAARVLRPGAVFAVYDVMVVGDGELTYPVPWSETPSTSFAAPPQTYRHAARAAGFDLFAEADRRDVALDFFARVQARAQADNARQPALGLHQLMGPTVQQKTANMVAAIRAGVIAPIQMTFRRDTSGVSP